MNSSLEETQTYGENNEKRVNLYPIFLRSFLIFCIIFFLLVIVFLLYQNGKSIYDHGI